MRTQRFVVEQKRGKPSHVTARAILNGRGETTHVVYETAQNPKTKSQRAKAVLKEIRAHAWRTERFVPATIGAHMIIADLPQQTSEAEEAVRCRREEYTEEIVASDEFEELVERWNKERDTHANLNDFVAWANRLASLLEDHRYEKWTETRLQMTRLTYEMSDGIAVPFVANLLIAYEQMTGTRIEPYGRQPYGDAEKIPSAEEFEAAVKAFEGLRS